MKNFLVVIVNVCFLRVEGASIVNGFAKPVEPNVGAFPFHASLMMPAKDGNGYFSFCGGSLIHPRWVLTAAHCIRLDEDAPAIKAKDTFVSLGTIFRSGKGGQTIGVESVSIHPNYLRSGGRSDIGLVKLKTNANIGRNIKMIKLHTNSGENLIGKNAFLTGFGIINDFYDTPQRLRKAVLHISNYDKCFSERAFEKVEICAASTIAEGKACKGDSGGPLTIIKNGRYIQVGVTSHLAILPFCRISFNNSVYTRVSAYIAWISRVTGIDFVKYNPSG